MNMPDVLTVSWSLCSPVLYRALGALTTWTSNCRLLYAFILTTSRAEAGEGKLAPKMEVDPKARAEFIFMMQFMEANITEPAGVLGSHSRGSSLPLRIPS